MIMRQVTKGIKDAVNTLTRKLTKKQIAVLAVIALALAVIFQSFIRALLSIAILFAIGAFSTYYKRKLEQLGAVGFELVTFTTTLTGVTFGPLIGALFGFATSFISVIISRDIGPTTVFFLVASTVIGAAAMPLSSTFGIVTLGLIAVAFSTMMVHSFTFFVQAETELKIVAAAGILTNFIVNYLFLSYAAGPLLALVS